MAQITYKHMIPLDQAVDLVAVERPSKLISLEEAGKILATKKVFGIAGTHSVMSAMALIRAAIKHGAKDITLVPPTSASMAADVWIAAGRLKKIYVSYIGIEGVGFAPAFRKAVQDGSIEVVESDEPFINLGTQAAAGGRPFSVLEYVWEGSSIPKLNPEIKTVVDPFTGRTVYAIPPLKTDVCILHASIADIYGNIQVWGGNRQEPDKAKAADMVIVQADEIVDTSEFRRDPWKTYIIPELVTYVVHTPFGAHPAFSPRRYAMDTDHLRMYVQMVRDGRTQEYLDRYVFGPKDHMEYLELVGVKRLVELQNMLSLQKRQEPESAD
ncbi:MAG: CoA transferase subunit A [Chloroflexi bacterium]|nr:CoA transferase subunit A [Chloroflexota bacterium]